MRYRFADAELDCARRELRVRGAGVPLQPQAFAVLQYLIEQRERMVPKAELLRKLWPGVRVGEASLQRAVSLARAALGEAGGLIRTHSKQGYRFCGDVVVEADAARVTGPMAVASSVGTAAAFGAAGAAAFVPRFARSEDVFIAFTTLGAGELDIVLMPGWVFPMRAYFELPEMYELVQSITRFGRVILFDKRGTGLSDRSHNVAPLEQRVDDLRAVLDAAGSRQSVLVGFSESGALGVLFATMYPERTRGLILAASHARLMACPGYPQGLSREAVDGVREYIERSWGAGDTLIWGLPSHRGRAETRAWAARAEQHGSSPGAALELLNMIVQIDVRPLLPSIGVPTAVVHSVGDAVLSVEQARYLAAHIAGARLWEVDGEDHFFVGPRADALRDALAWIVSEPVVWGERFLTSVLAFEAGPAAGAALDLGSLDAMATRYRGVRAGAGCLWSFDGPQRAIRCGHELARRCEGRVGVHAGEVSGAAGRLAGTALDIARAIAVAARPGTVLVSRVVRDLVHGSTLAFGEQGEVVLFDGGRMHVLESRADGAGALPEQE